MITPDEWAGILDDFQQTVDKFPVPLPEQDEPEVIVGATRDAIVIAPVRDSPRRRIRSRLTPQRLEKPRRSGEWP